jgi:hypothetical protein
MFKIRIDCGIRMKINAGPSGREVISLHKADSFPGNKGRGRSKKSCRLVGVD